MIKLNLKQTKVSTAIGESSAEDDSRLSATSLTSNMEQFIGQIDLSELDSGFFVKFSIKLILIASIPLAFKIYEIYNITLLEKEKTRVESVLSSKNGESAELRKKIESFSHLKKQAEEYEIKKNLLKKLAYSRLIVPKFLDQVQSVIPDSVWLTGVRVSGSKEVNKITLDGESVNEESVNNFLVYLKDVVQENSIQFSTRDVKKKGRLVRVRFNIKADL